ncbi:MAG: PQQ-binding-like beta-propeller repeat protein [Planctomycetaceae bacterium]|nr:PQQ-binding-like beta-propeller repeat protein [Planctomycetales bacterium]MCB9926844.1 PQQ-binding-like beta-propeller repeat protein [Planctomycetaceae bacterium]
MIRGATLLFLLLTLALMECQRATAQVPFGPDDWPQWRGPNRDGISSDKGLMTEWPEGGPEALWQVDTVGVSYSSLAVKDGRIFTQGDLGGVEHTICLSSQDGSVLWAVQPEPLVKTLDERVANEFRNADRDHNGTIDETEAWQRFGRAFNDYDRAAGRDARQVATERAHRLFASLDANRDKHLTFAEAGQVLRDEFERFDAEDRTVDAQKLAASRAAALFAAIDKDEDGKISREESRHTELERLFNQADMRDPATNKGDELLTEEEVETYLAKRQTGRDGVLNAAEVEDRLVREFAGKDGILTREELRAFYGGYRNGMGDGPRGTPTVDGDRVYVEGGNGDLTCLAAATGQTVWHTNLVSDLGGGRPGWGYSESPLIEGELVIVTPGGRQGTLAALNKMTGEVVWRSSDIVEAAHYSSPVAADICGVREIVQFARENVFGINAKTGEFLWKYGAASNGTANCFTPIVYTDNVLVSSAYGTGTGAVRITASGGKQVAEELYFLKKLQSHHGGAVRIGDFVYSNGGGTLLCVNYLTGDIAWESRSVGKGSLVAADGMLYVLSEGHQVALVEANSDKYVERGRFKIESHGRPSWAHPVVAGGRLYIRDQGSLTAYNVRP